MESTNSTLENEVKQGSKWSMRDLWHFVLLIVFVVLPIRYFVAQPFIVSGASMDPTFTDGQYIIVDQLTYKFNNATRGDVIIFRYAGDTSKFFIKRIIGLPGEIVKIAGNEIFIKKVGATEFEKLDEQDITKDFSFTAEWTLLPDELFVMGDNRKNSLDSRYFGPIKKDTIIGRAFVRLLPLTTIDYLPGKLNL